MITKYCKGCGCYIQDTVKHDLFHEQLDDLVTAVNQLKDVTMAGFGQMAEVLDVLAKGRRP